MDTNRQNQDRSARGWRGVLRARVFGLALLLASAVLSISTSSRLAAQGSLKIPDLSTSLGGKPKPAAAEHARAQLVADVKSIAPGKPFRIGVKYAIDPQWHIYWRNFGDVGVPTTIKWKLPDGFQVGELQWPAPERATMGEFVLYGYEKEALLFVTVTPPATLAAGTTIKLAAHSEWLVCKDECVPGKAELSLDLPVAAAGQAATPSAEAELFKRYAATVPGPRVVDGEGASYIQIAWNPAAPEIKNDDHVTSIGVIVTTHAPFEIDASKYSEHMPGLFPLAPDEQFDTTHPRLVMADAKQANYVWQLKARPQTNGAYDVTGVFEVPLKNTATGESKTVYIADAAKVRVINVATSATAAAGAGSATGTTNTTVLAGAAAVSETAGGPGMPGASGGKNGGLSFLSATPKSENSFLGFLWFAFLGGMLLNIMPCVLPVLSIKVLGFVRQSGESRGHIFGLGLAYGAGVLASFGALAAVLIVLKQAGAQAGWGFQLQNPTFVILMSAFIFIFSLSLFGVFSLDLPGSAAGQLDSLSRREGFGGAFTSGVLATLLATPCTGPFMGSAIGYAIAQPAATIFLFCLVCGLGLALPYIVLSTNPALLKFVPKPGAWMETFKQFMGFPMLATVLFLLYVLGSQAGAEGIIWTCAFLLTIGMACWLFGQAQDLRAGKMKRRLLPLFALALVVVGYFAFPARFLSGFESQALAQGTGGAAGAGVVSINAAGWQPFSVARIEQLVKGDRAVFVDFTADWCLQCKVNEKAALESDRVREAFKKYNVATVKADWTRRDDEIARVLAQFGRSGVPLYVIFPAGHPESPIVLPSVITPEMVAKSLADAGSGKVTASTN